MDNNLKIIVYVIVFLLLFSGVFLTLQSIRLMELAKDGLNDVYKRLHDKNSARIEELEKSRRKYGQSTSRVNGKESLIARKLQKLDRLIAYSQVNLKFKWLNTSTYVVTNLVLMSLVFMAILYVTGSLFYALLGLVLTLIIPYGYMVHLTDVNYLKTEENLRHFVTSVANYSAVTDDIVTVMEQIAPEVSEPLKGVLNKATLAASVSGSKSDCMRMIIDGIEHPLLVRFIRDLEVCGQYHAKYDEVASSSLIQMKKALQEAEARRADNRNARIELCILLFAGIILTLLWCALVQYSPVQVYRMMQASTLGQACLYIITGVIIGLVSYMTIGMRR